MSSELQPLLALDVTGLLNQPISGIQRVILELVPRLCQTGLEQGLAVALVDSLGPRSRVLFHWDEPVGPVAIQQALADVASGRVLWGNWRKWGWVAQTLGGCLRALPLKTVLRRSRALRLGVRHARAFLHEYLPATRRHLERADYYLGFSAGILPLRLPHQIDPERVLLILHDFIPLTHPRFVAPEVTRAFAENFTHLACCGRNYRFLASCTPVAAELQAMFHGLARRPVAVRQISWGYARDKFYPEPEPGFRQALGVPPDSAVVLAVSTQEPRKRFRDIENAVSLLNSQRPTHGVFVGRGPKTGRDQGPIHYLGHVSDDLLRRAYSSCDVYVNWSAAEGFGLPVVEALACGARVIVPPDNETLRELGGAEVRVADAPTVDGLARAIAATLDTAIVPRPVPDLRRFDWDECSRAILEELGASQPSPGLPLRTLRAA